MTTTPESIARQAKRVLIAHDADRMECSAHEHFCCPLGDAHNFDSRAGHQAHALEEAGLLRHDIKDDFEKYGIASLTLDNHPGGQTHVLIVDTDGEQLVNGYVQPPEHGTVEVIRAAIRDGQVHIPTPTPWEQEARARMPRVSLGDRLRALADTMLVAPVTAEVLRQYAAEADQLGREPVENDQRLREFGDFPGWTVTIQQHADREQRVRDLAAALVDEYPDPSGVVQGIVARIHNALDPHPTEGHTDGS